MNCPNCGKEIEESKFCPECGAKIDDDSNAENSQNKDPSNAYYEALKRIEDEKAQAEKEQKKKKKRRKAIGCSSAILVLVILIASLYTYNYFATRCHVCKGKGTIICTECKNGKAVCEKCNGNKYICETCSGSGEVLSDERCGACEDSKRPGYIYNSNAALRDIVSGNIEKNPKDPNKYWNECSVCDGTGYKSETCPDCKGSGTGDKECPACNGSGEVKCEKCNGSAEVKCYLCDGTGKID